MMMESRVCKIPSARELMNFYEICLIDIKPIYLNKTIPTFLFLPNLSIPSGLVFTVTFMVDPLSYFYFQPVLHDWCNKGRGMCYHGMMHIKEPLLLIGYSSPYGGSGFPPCYLSGPLPYV